MLPSGKKIGAKYRENDEAGQQDSYCIVIIMNSLRLLPFLKAIGSEIKSRRSKYEQIYW